MAEDREGRGRLSSLDLIPEDGREDIAWALAELNKRERTQADILFELNDRLAVKGIAPISKSAFNRRSMMIATRSRATQDRIAIGLAIAPTLTPEAIADGDTVFGEYVKTVIDTALDDRPSARDVHDLAKAYHHILSAQKISVEMKSKALKEGRARALGVVDAVEGEIAKRGGSSSGAAVLKKIREDIYGIFQE